MKQHATPEGIDTHLNEIAGQFLDIVFPYAVVFGSLTMAVSLYRSWIHGWYSTIIWHTIMYGGSIAVILFRRRLPSILAISTILAFICIDVFRSLYLMGLTDGGVTGLVVLGILVGIFIGIRAGIAAILLGTAAAAVIGVLICTGLVVPLIDEGRYLRSPDAWFLQLSVVLVYALPLVVTAHILRQRVSRSVSELQEMNGRLRSEVAMRRQAEGDSRNIEIKYREILERAGEGIFQMNLDGRFLAVNPALAHMTGYAFPQEMLADQDRNMYSIFTNREDETCLIEKARYGEGIENLEMEIRTRDLRTVWVRINMRCIRGEDGSPDYLEGTVQDITGWRMAEVALQESELKYRSVVENSLVASYIIQDGFFRFVNTTFSVLTGYSREELTEGMMPADIVHPEYRKAWREAMNGTAYGQPDMLELELRIQKKDGNAVAVKALAGSTSYNGRVAIFGTFIDISKEKALEAQLRQAQKMEAIGTLTGGIAHDFNNILTALTGYATLLQMRLGEADPLRHYVDQILSASNKATSLTQSLLTFGRRQPISLRPVDIRSVVEGTQSLLQRLITEDISLVTKFTDDPMIVMADTTQIDQILFNLATNARDAMPDGGTLAISVDRVFMGNDFMEANGFGKAGTYAMLSVADTGVGMDDETRERIFDPFFTTKEFGKGTGLGLSTVYGIVKQHKGYIRASSRPLQGTTFYIYLPLAKRPGIEARPSSPALVQRQDGSQTILVADDNAEVRKLVRDILDHYGYRVVEAADGEDAVNAFVANDNIALVVLDSVMPKRNGRQAYDAMRAVKSNVKALFMSGYTMDTILDKGVNEGEMDFIEKPLIPVNFLKKVEEIIARPV